MGFDADDFLGLVDEDRLVFEEFHAGDGGGEALDGAFDGGDEEVVGDFVGVGHAQEGVGLVGHAGFVGGGGLGFVEGAVGGEEAEVEAGDVGVFGFAGGEDPKVHAGGAFRRDLLRRDVPFGPIFGAAHGTGVDEGLGGALGVIGGAAGEGQKGKAGEGGGVFHSVLQLISGWADGGGNENVFRQHSSEALTKPEGNVCRKTQTRRPMGGRVRAFAVDAVPFVQLSGFRRTSSHATRG